MPVNEHIFSILLLFTRLRTTILYWSPETTLEHVRFQEAYYAMIDLKCGRPQKRSNQELWSMVHYNIRISISKCYSPIWVQWLPFISMSVPLSQEGPILNDNSTGFACSKSQLQWVTSPSKGSDSKQCKQHLSEILENCCQSKQVTLGYVDDSLG